MGIVVDALRRLEERGTGVGAFANAAADAREVRNACAGNVEATRALRESDGCGTLLRLMRDAATSGGKTLEEEEDGRLERKIKRRRRALDYQLEKEKEETKKNEEEGKKKTEEEAKKATK